jgi:hypothetical protein
VSRDRARGRRTRTRRGIRHLGPLQRHARVRHLPHGRGRRSTGQQTKRRIAPPPAATLKASSLRSTPTNTRQRDLRCLRR